MEDYGAEMGIEMFLLHICGRAFAPILGMMPVIALLIFCAIYTPIIIDMLRSAYRADEIPP